MNLNKKVAVIAVGGNSLIQNGKKSIPDQYQAAKETSSHISKMISSGWSVIIAHGNGPQVGFILRRSELSLHELHPVPLDYCGADTQGSIGYMFQQSLQNEFRKLGINKTPVTIVTQVRVDSADPAFKNPSKPIGSFMDEDSAKEKAEKENWSVKEDSGRGWRRVVPSPPPIEIIERDAIKELVNKDFVVIAVGGGGIPVIHNDSGDLEGVAAVIDKDFASSLLATEVGADLFLISTAVEKVYLNFGSSEQQSLDQVTTSQLKKYINENHFAAGSMLPKILAVLQFFENGGKRAIITNPENIERALNGETGTHIIP